MLIDASAVFLLIQTGAHAESPIGRVMVMVDFSLREVTSVLCDDNTVFILSFRIGLERAHDRIFFIATLILAD